MPSLFSVRLSYFLFPSWLSLVVSSLLVPWKAIILWASVIYVQEISQYRDCIKVYNDRFTTVYNIDTWLLLSLLIYLQHLVPKRFLPTHKYVLKSHSQTVSLLLFFLLANLWGMNAVFPSMCMTDSCPSQDLCLLLETVSFIDKVNICGIITFYVFNLVKAWGLLKTTTIFWKKEQ